ncbi:uncharacterized protein [Ambystoma mexicanum]|uniref:uncharacterized protein n=1 Tax=Ambystoma mexicanum TaxID=8296 RepID=UPI0037E96108
MLSELPTTLSITTCPSGTSIDQGVNSRSLTSTTSLDDITDQKELSTETTIRNIQPFTATVSQMSTYRKGISISGPDTRSFYATKSEESNISTVPTTAPETLSGGGKKSEMVPVNSQEMKRTESATAFSTVSNTTPFGRVTSHEYATATLGHTISRDPGATSNAPNSTRPVIGVTRQRVLATESVITTSQTFTAMAPHHSTFHEVAAVPDNITMSVFTINSEPTNSSTQPITARNGTVNISINISLNSQKTSTTDSGRAESPLSKPSGQENIQELIRLEPTAASQAAKVTGHEIPSLRETMIALGSKSMSSRATDLRSPTRPRAEAMASELTITELNTTTQLWPPTSHAFIDAISTAKHMSLTTPSQVATSTQDQLRNTQDVDISQAEIATETQQNTKRAQPGPSETNPATDLLQIQSPTTY